MCGCCDGDRGGLHDRSHRLCDLWHAMLRPPGLLGSAVIGRVAVVGIVMLVVAVDVDIEAVVDADPIAALT